MPKCIGLLIQMVVCIPYIVSSKIVGVLMLFERFIPFRIYLYFFWYYRRMFKYFKALFNSHSAHFLPHDMTSNPKLNYTQVVSLEFNVSYQEILNALHGMNVNKILCLDDFNSHFFISYWDTIRELFS